MKWLKNLKHKASKYKGFSWMVKVIPIYHLLILLVCYIELACLIGDPNSYVFMAESYTIYAPISIFIGAHLGTYGWMMLVILFFAAWLFGLCWRYYSCLIFLTVHLAFKNGAFSTIFSFEEATTLITTCIVIISILLLLILELLIRTTYGKRISNLANRTRGVQ